MCVKNILSCYYIKDLMWVWFHQILMRVVWHRRLTSHQQFVPLWYHILIHSAKDRKTAQKEISFKITDTVGKK